MIRYKVRDAYDNLTDFTVRLPTTFQKMEGVIRDYRNIIKVVDAGGERLVIKNFRGMYFFNRLAYSLFRESKAVRSYAYSEILNRHGIKTPAHVAWVNCYAMGLLTESYFVSVFCPWPTLESVMENFSPYDEFQVRVLKHLAAFARKLHGLGICHHDFSVGNILVREMDDTFDFALLDLNRMKFGHVRYEEGIRNFDRLALPSEAINILVSAYADLAGEDRQQAVYRFWKYKVRKSSLRKFRKTLKRKTLLPIERIFKGK